MIYIGSFTYAGVTYDRYLDVTNPASPTVVVTTIGFPVLSHVSAANRGEVDGGLFPQPYGKQCYTDPSDLTEYYYNFYSQANTPFASVLVFVSGCPAVICDLLIGLITTTDETAINAKDGTMNAVITTTNAPYRCTLDNINFLPPNTSLFTNLTPGGYTLFVFDAQACVAQHNFVINKYAAISGCTDPAASNYNPSAQINDGSCIYPLPDNNADQVSNLYEKPDEFRLTYNNTVYQIAEPKDWDKVSIVLKRDAVYHGVNYAFSEGDIKLRFDDPAGQQILLGAYLADGNDALVRFQFGYDQFGVFIPYFDAFVDFNSYEKQEFYTALGVKRKLFSDLLQTRADTLVSLRDKGLQLPLHSKQIFEQTVVNDASPGGIGTMQTLSVNPYSGGMQEAGAAPFLAYYTYLDFSRALPNDLCTDAPLWGVYSDNPVVTGQHTFQADGGGVFNFAIDFNVSIHIKLEQNSFCIGTGPRHGYWSYRWFLVVNNFPNAYELPGGVAGFQSSRYNDVGYVCSGYTKQLTLNQGDQVYLFGMYICEQRGCVKDAVVRMDRVYENLNISAGTLSLASQATSFMAFETAAAIINYVTNGQLSTPAVPLTTQAKLVSNLLGRTDIGYNSDGCAALLAYTNGYQIRGFDIANRPVQISFADFMQGLNALYCVGFGYEIDSLGNFLVRIEGFEYFYQDVEMLFLDGVSDYLEPIDESMIFNELEFGYKKYTNKLPSSSYTLDEFNTVHNYLTPIQSHKQKLSQLCSQIASGYAIELTRRQKFAQTPSDSYTYDEDNFVISTVRDGPSFKSETLENYTASGIVGPDTAYNIRLSCSRMVDRWSKLINSGLAYKQKSDILTNSHVALNGDLVSQLITPNNCDSVQAFTESASIVLGEVGGNVKIFSPEKITFKKRISWPVMSFLIRCFQNQDTTGLNNGYISVVDPDGNTQQGFLMELDYNPETELANFTLRKKFVDLNQPFDCSIYSSDDFAQLEASTGLPAAIEQCLFSNFA